MPTLAAVKAGGGNGPAVEVEVSRASFDYTSKTNSGNDAFTGEGQVE